jgi:hypothetical protein
MVDYEQYMHQCYLTCPELTNMTNWYDTHEALATFLVQM